MLRNRNAERKAVRDARIEVRDVQDIGDLPPVANLARRQQGEFNLSVFLETYFPNLFLWPFSGAHQKAIGKIQRAVLEGGKFVEALPRGYGKTTIAECSTLWAVLYGHSRFTFIVGADASAAESNIVSIKRELEGNELLMEDFPEACFPAKALEGVAQRAKGQRYTGKQTNIEWRKDTIVFATVGGKSDGSIISAAGITGRIRGRKHKRADGKQVRPDFVFIDDPQTHESSKAPMQCRDRLKILTNDIINLAGHKKPISILIACTVIEKNDMADQLLDSEQYPLWEGERTPMLLSWAEKHDELWLGKYRDILKSFDREIDGDNLRARKEATEFYRNNRVEMDAGARVSWEFCFDPERELSAVQHAYNQYFSMGVEAFASEMQNKPLEPQDYGTGNLTIEILRSKLNGLKAGEVPLGVNNLTAFIDVQDKILFFMVCGWKESDFSGWILEYSTYPQQPVSYFGLSDIRMGLKDITGNATQEGAWLSGISALCRQLSGRVWFRADGVELRLSRVLIDANDGQARNSVYAACSDLHLPQFMPFHSVAPKATAKGMESWTMEPGERRGDNWFIRAGKQQKNVLRLTADVDYWKTQTRSRLLTPLHDAGSLSIFGDEHNDHALLFDHLTSEYGTEISSPTRRKIEWNLKPNRENHWWDCCTGCTIGTSEQGTTLAGMREKKLQRKPPRFVSLAERMGKYRR